MNRNEAQAVASENNLGEVLFQHRIALNTGKEFEVGYVFVQGKKELFCKRQSYMTSDEFYLCNEYRKLRSEG